MGRCGAVILSMLPLAGCFVSQQHLIDANIAAYPLLPTAAVESYTWNGDDRSWQHSHYHTLARAGNGYRLIDDNGKTINFTLMALSSTSWLVEEEGSDDGHGGVTYGLLTRDELGQYFVRTLEDTCDRLSANRQLAANYGIGIDGDDCVLRSINALRRVVTDNIDDIMDEEPTSAYVIR